VTARIPLHPELVALAASMPVAGYWFPADRRGNTGGRGCVLPRSVSTIVSTAMRRAGVPGTAHSLRHWYGTALVDSGADLRTTQTLLRHASLATTQLYTAVSQRRQREAIDRLRAA
jgi:integrase/recombinase XerD